MSSTRVSELMSKILAKLSVYLNGGQANVLLSIPSRILRCIGLLHLVVVEF